MVVEASSIQMLLHGGTKKIGQNEEKVKCIYCAEVYRKPKYTDKTMRKRLQDTSILNNISWPS